MLNLWRKAQTGQKKGSSIPVVTYTGQTTTTSEEVLNGFVSDLKQQGYNNFILVYRGIPTITKQLFVMPSNFGAAFARYAGGTNFVTFSIGVSYDAIINAGDEFYLFIV